MTHYGLTSVETRFNLINLEPLHFWVYYMVQVLKPQSELLDLKKRFKKLQC